MKILIVDDEPTCLLLLRQLLQAAGHEVFQADSGVEALKALDQNPVPLIIADWMMPEMNGLELFRRVRARRSDWYVYLILLTSREGRADYHSAMEAGADDFMNKPVDAGYLATRIQVAQRILDLQSTVRQLRGLLPICSYCKKIKNEEGVWTRLEQYLAAHSDASFSHGICRECLAREMASLEHDEGS
jgi:sigma-B regulation protein RsbU (phosphoserine phosphatase)